MLVLDCLNKSLSQLLSYGMTICFVCLSCTDGDISKHDNCILSTIQFDDFNKLQFTTVSGGQIYYVRQTFTFEGETKTVAFYQFTYFEDSLVIKDQLAQVSSLTPYISVKFEDEKPIQVVRFFNSSGVKLVHDFDYSQKDRLQVSLTRVASNGQSLFAAYANYHMNSAGNVSRIERFGIDPDDRSVFILNEDRVFSYDDFKSPVKGYYLPFFTDTNLPDVKFFSTNNVLSIAENNTTARYEYIYDASNNTTAQIPPSGQPVIFSYLNCP
ncbi:MAG: hypothetical protein ACI8QD_000150 [Cyclobacteriaceae bacterium]|jgi:hypothetical protein